ncbi:hypothetical protein [Nostoc sp.]|uniref:hypothetical protein n=1 Tax=Nostoc sp. TaxID=1180 RepID=UPI002FF5264D
MTDYIALRITSKQLASRIEAKHPLLNGDRKQNKFFFNLVSDPLKSIRAGGEAHKNFANIHVIRLFDCICDRSSNSLWRNINLAEILHPTMCLTIRNTIGQF